MRLIDADALGVGRCSKDVLPAAHCAGWNGLLNLVETAPTIDPASLRPKGEWIYNTDAFTPRKRCTHCGYNKPIAAGLCIEQEPDNFCPNCGADMRGEATPNV